MKINYFNYKKANYYPHFSDNNLLFYIYAIFVLQYGSI